MRIRRIKRGPSSWGELRRSWNGKNHITPTAIIIATTTMLRAGTMPTAVMTESSEKTISRSMICTMIDAKALAAFWLVACSGSGFPSRPGDQTHPSLSCRKDLKHCRAYYTSAGAARLAESARHYHCLRMCVAYECACPPHRSVAMPRAIPPPISL